jgi:hypothetical protein
LPPTETDFWSQRKIYESTEKSSNTPVFLFGKPPQKNEKLECIARACSLFESKEAAKDRQKRVLKFRKQQIYMLTLHENDGMVLQKEEHISWWISTSWKLVQ